MIADIFFWSISQWIQTENYGHKQQNAMQKFLHLNALFQIRWHVVFCVHMLYNANCEELKKASSTSSTKANSTVLTVTAFWIEFELNSFRKSSLNVAEPYFTKCNMFLDQHLSGSTPGTTFQSTNYIWETSLKQHSNQPIRKILQIMSSLGLQPRLSASR